MKRFVIITAVALLSGCSNLSWIMYDERKGYKDYDPCIRCGEGWIQLPNQPFEAQERRRRGEHW